MVNYKSEKQLSIFDFKTGFESKLDANNRWVRLCSLLDWDKLSSIYHKSLSTQMGAKGIDSRVVIGALIIKYLERKDDRGTIEAISENPYMQYFLGFDHFDSKPIFDPSLFVSIRKRLGNESFDEMNQIIIKQALTLSQESRPAEDSRKNEEEEKDNLKQNESIEKPLTNKGKLQMDATVADAYIKFPTDLGLLNDSREKSEELLDKLCKSLSIGKPRTYRIKARKEWINLSKNKNKQKKVIRKGISQQLSYLKRNLQSVDKILINNPLALNELTKAEYKYLLVINELYRQQFEMFRANKHSIEHRIVSIHQPHIRPIVRGKAGKKVEFGAKINVSLQEGFARIDQLSFEAFNEGTFLKDQVERYKKLNGYYPELVQTDDIYMTKENRKYLKENGIRHTGKALGRKPKQVPSTQEKAIRQIERNQRNHIEGKFGQGKVKYNLNKIMAKISDTTESWIAGIFFVMNILKLSKDFLCLFLIRLTNVLFQKKQSYFQYSNLTMTSSI